jgi:hypothetical protein
MPEKKKKQTAVDLASPGFLALLQKEIALAANPAGDIQASDTLGPRVGTRERRMAEEVQAQDKARENAGQAATDRAREVLPAARGGAQRTARSVAQATTAGTMFPSQQSAAGILGSEETQRTATGPFVSQQNQQLEDAEKALQLIAIAASRGKSGSLVKDMGAGINELKADPMQLVPFIRMFTSPSASDRTGDILRNEPAMNAGATPQQNALVEAQRLYQQSGNAPTTTHRDVTYYGAQIPTFLLEGEGISKGLGLVGRGVMSAARAVLPKIIPRVAPEAARDYLLRGILERTAIGAGERAAARTAVGAGERALARGATTEAEGLGAVAREKAGELAKHELTAKSAHSTQPHSLEDISRRLVYGY